MCVKYTVSAHTDNLLYITQIMSSHVFQLPAEMFTLYFRNFLSKSSTSKHLKSNRHQCDRKGLRRTFGQLLGGVTIFVIVVIVNII